ncbi:hypothetical protein PT974_01750 [Cladobotryum mycophilum]|uniref:CENP-V/GFA domain-containing protein n=1 Tax=Cladobotryum mycophilum TaxID=491253 RepID=A0ABR0SW69_9HYPO
MPLPREPIAIRGGCNCGAVRYRITIPSFEERQLYFVHAPEEASNPETPRLPLICFCHCNDCRAATGSLLPSWCLAPKEMVTISCLPSQDDDGSMQRLRLAPHDASGDSERPSYVPAYGLVSGTEPTTGTWLRVYRGTDESMEGWDVDKRVHRSFCGRCGTNLFYVICPMPNKFTNMVDVYFGTVDREDLEKPWAQPERQVWHNYGISWIKDAVKDLDGPKHPSFSTKEFVQE